MGRLARRPALGHALDALAQLAGVGAGRQQQGPGPAPPRWPRPAGPWTSTSGAPLSAAIWTALASSCLAGSLSSLPTSTRCTLGRVGGQDSIPPNTRRVRLFETL
ncbi:hypothetical protein [Nonomuraea dietziae]|uniref:hypothetical protein n=1 Tax=Nonomuraea dietziae TaxID=65515 RepID=UPI0031D87C42